MSAQATILNKNYTQYRFSSGETYTYNITATSGNTVVLFLTCRGTMTTGPDSSWNYICTMDLSKDMSYHQDMKVYSKVVSGNETVQISQTENSAAYFAYTEFEGSDIEIYKLPEYTEENVKKYQKNFRRYDLSTHIWICSSYYFWNDRYSWDGYNSVTYQLPDPSQKISARVAIFLDNTSTNSFTLSCGSDPNYYQSYMGLRIVKKSSVRGIWDGRIYGGYYIYDTTYSPETTNRLTQDSTDPPGNGGHYVMIPVEANKKYKFTVSGTGINRQRVGIFSGVNYPLTSTSYTAFRYVGETTSTPTVPYSMTFETQLGDEYLFIYVASGTTGTIDVLMDVLPKFLISDENDYLYTIQNNILVRITGSATNLTKALFENNGIYTIETPSILNTLQLPKILAMNDSDFNMVASGTLIPNPQVIEGNMNFSDSSIGGFSEIAATYSGNVNVQYSYDNSTWTTPDTMTNFLNIDMDTLYSGLSSSKILYIRVILEDENASFTKLIISCKNSEE